MYNEDRKPNHKDPVGRFVLLSAFKGKALKRHAEGDKRKYMEMCGRALIRMSATNKIEHVQVIDVRDNIVIYDGRA